MALTAFFSCLLRKMLCFSRSIKAYLCANMINFDSVDFSGRRPEEVISFFWRSVYTGNCVVGENPQGFLPFWHRMLGCFHGGPLSLEISFWPFPRLSAVFLTCLFLCRSSHDLIAMNETSWRTIKKDVSIAQYRALNSNYGRTKLAHVEQFLHQWAYYKYTSLIIPKDNFIKGPMKCKCMLTCVDL